MPDNKPVGVIQSILDAREDNVGPGKSTARTTPVEPIPLLGKPVARPIDPIESGVRFKTRTPSMGITEDVRSKFSNEQISPTLGYTPIMEMAAIRQGNWETLGRGTARFLGTTVAELGRFLPNVWEGSKQLIGMSDPAQSYRDMTNNVLINFFDSMEDSIKENAPIYWQQAARDGNLLEAISSGEFWADEFAQGAGFFAGMFLPALIARGTGLTQKMATGTARTINAGKRVFGKPLITAQRARALNLHGYTAMQTFSEAATEARFAGKEFYDELMHKVQNGDINPDTNRPWTEEDAATKAGEVASHVFKGNLAILGVSNTIMNRMLFGNVKARGSVTAAQANRSKTVIEKISDSMVGRMATGIASEGFWEEGSQTALENWARDVAENGDETQIDGILGQEIGQFLTAYTDMAATTQGQRSIFIGAVLGSIGGAVENVRQDHSVEEKIVANRKKAMQMFAQNFGTDFLLRDEKGNIVKDDKGRPKVDPVKIKEAAKDNILTFLDVLNSTSSMHDPVTHNMVAKKGIARVLGAYVGDKASMKALEQDLPGLIRQMQDQYADSGMEFSLSTDEVMKMARDMDREYRRIQAISGQLMFSSLKKLDATEQEMADFMNEMNEAYVAAAVFNMINEDAVQDMEKLGLIEDSAEFIRRKEQIEKQIEENKKTLKAHRNLSERQIKKMFKDWKTEKREQKKNDENFRDDMENGLLKDELTQGVKGFEKPFITIGNKETGASMVFPAEYSVKTESGEEISGLSPYIDETAKDLRKTMLLKDENGSTYTVSENEDGSREITDAKGRAQKISDVTVVHSPESALKTHILKKIEDLYNTPIVQQLSQIQEKIAKIPNDKKPESYKESKDTRDELISVLSVFNTLASELSRAGLDAVFTKDDEFQFEALNDIYERLENGVDKYSAQDIRQMVNEAIKHLKEGKLNFLEMMYPKLKELFSNDLSNVIQDIENIPEEKHIKENPPPPKKTPPPGDTPSEMITYKDETAPRYVGPASWFHTTINEQQAQANLDPNNSTARSKQATAHLAYKKWAMDLAIRPSKNPHNQVAVTVNSIEKLESYMSSTVYQALLDTVFFYSEKTGEVASARDAITRKDEFSGQTIVIPFTVVQGQMATMSKGGSTLQASLIKPTVGYNGKYATASEAAKASSGLRFNFEEGASVADVQKDLDNYKKFLEEADRSPSGLQISSASAGGFSDQTIEESQIPVPIEQHISSAKEFEDLIKEGTIKIFINPNTANSTQGEYDPQSDRQVGKPIAVGTYPSGKTINATNGAVLFNSGGWVSPIFMDTLSTKDIEEITKVFEMIFRYYSGLREQGVTGMDEKIQPLIKYLQQLFSVTNKDNKSKYSFRIVYDEKNMSGTYLQFGDDYSGKTTRIFFNSMSKSKNDPQINEKTLADNLKAINAFLHTKKYSLNNRSIKGNHPWVKLSKVGFKVDRDGVMTGYDLELETTKYSYAVGFYGHAGMRMKVPFTKNSHTFSVPMKVLPPPNIKPLTKEQVDSTKPIVRNKLFTPQSSHRLMVGDNSYTLAINKDGSISKRSTILSLLDDEALSNILDQDLTEQGVLDALSKATKQEFTAIADREGNVLFPQQGQDTEQSLFERIWNDQEIPTEQKDLAKRIRTLRDAGMSKEVVYQKFLESQKPKDDGWFRATRQVNNLSRNENLEQELDTLSKLYPWLDVEVIESTLDNGLTVGKVADAHKIIVSRLGEEGTAFHELFHVLHLAYVAKKDRSAHYDELRSRLGDTIVRVQDGKKFVNKKGSELTDKQAEEYLAELFRDYMLTGGQIDIPSPKAKSVFKRIIDAILRFFGFDVTDNQTVERFFERIVNNPESFSGITPDQTALSEPRWKILDLSATTEYALLHDVNVEFFRIMFKEDEFGSIDHQRLMEFESSAAEIYRDLYASLIMDSSENGIIGGLFNNDIDRFNEAWPEVVIKHKEFLRSFGITSDESSQEEIDEMIGGKPVDFMDSGEESAFVKMPKPIKLLLMGIPVVSEANQELYGRPEYNTIDKYHAKITENFNHIAVLIHRNISGISDYPKAMQVLISLAETTNPELAILIRRIEGQNLMDRSNMLGTAISKHQYLLHNAFITTFNKAIIKPVEYLSKNGVSTFKRIDIAEQQRKLLSEWKTNVGLSDSKVFKGTNLNVKEDIIPGLPLVDAADQFGGLSMDRQIELMYELGIPFEKDPRQYSDEQYLDIVEDVQRLLASMVGIRPDGKNYGKVEWLESNSFASASEKNSIISKIVQNSKYTVEPSINIGSEKHYLIQQHTTVTLLAAQLDQILRDPTLNTKEHRKQRLLELGLLPVNYGGNNLLLVGNKVIDDIINGNIKELSLMDIRLQDGLELTQVSSTDIFQKAVLQINSVLNGYATLPRTGNRKRNDTFRIDRDLGSSYEMVEQRYISAMLDYLKADLSRAVSSRVNNPGYVNLQNNASSLTFFSDIVGPSKVLIDELAKGNNNIKDIYTRVNNHVNQNMEQYVEQIREHFTKEVAKIYTPISEDMSHTQSLLYRSGILDPATHQLHPSIGTNSLERIGIIVKTDDADLIDISEEQAMHLAAAFVSGMQQNLWETGTLFIGDAANFKNAKEWNKRASGANSTKLIPRSDATGKRMGQRFYGRIDGKEYSSDATVVIYKDQPTKIAKEVEDSINKITDPFYSEENKKAYLNWSGKKEGDFLNTKYEATDAQSRMSLDFWRQFQVEHGMWDENHERFYMYQMQEYFMQMIQYNLRAKKEQRTEDVLTYKGREINAGLFIEIFGEHTNNMIPDSPMFQGEIINPVKLPAIRPMKPQGYTNELDPILGSRVVKFTKTSMSVILPTEHWDPREQRQPDVWYETLDMMNNEGIVDFYTFPSGQKGDRLPGVEYDVPLSDAPTQTRAMDSMGIQVFEPAKPKVELTNSKQTMNLQSVDLFGRGNGETFSDLKDTDQKHRNLMASYVRNRVFSALSELSMGPNQTFDKRVFTEAMKNLLETNQIDLNTYNNIVHVLDKHGTLDAIMDPIPVINQVISIIRKAGIDMKVPGMLLPQETEYGMEKAGFDKSERSFDNELQFYHIRDGEIQPMEVRVPIPKYLWKWILTEFGNTQISDPSVRMRDAFLKFKEAYESNSERIPEEMKYGYINRTPADNRHSMGHVRVAQYLMPWEGYKIVVPPQGVIMFGFDFDYDKLNFYGYAPVYNEVGEISFPKDTTNVRERIMGFMDSAQSVHTLLVNHLGDIPGMRELYLNIDGKGLSYPEKILQITDKMDEIYRSRKDLYDNPEYQEAIEIRKELRHTLKMIKRGLSDPNTAEGRKAQLRKVRSKVLADIDRLTEIVAFINMPYDSRMTDLKKDLDLLKKSIVDKVIELGGAKPIMNNDIQSDASIANQLMDIRIGIAKDVRLYGAMISPTSMDQIKNPAKSILEKYDQKNPTNFTTIFSPERENTVMVNMMASVQGVGKQAVGLIDHVKQQSADMVTKFNILLPFETLAPRKDTSKPASPKAYTGIGRFGYYKNTAGVPVSMTNSSKVNSVLDTEKDPYFYNLGLYGQAESIFSFLTQIGINDNGPMDVETALLFLNSAPVKFILQATSAGRIEDIQATKNAIHGNLVQADPEYPEMLLSDIYGMLSSSSSKAQQYGASLLSKFKYDKLKVFSKQDLKDMSTDKYITSIYDFTMWMDEFTKGDMGRLSEILQLMDTVEYLGRMAEKQGNIASRIRLESGLPADMGKILGDLEKSNPALMERSGAFTNTSTFFTENSFAATGKFAWQQAADTLLSLFDAYSNKSFAKILEHVGRMMQMQLPEGSKLDVKNIPFMVLSYMKARNMRIRNRKLNTLLHELFDAESPRSLTKQLHKLRKTRAYRDNPWLKYLVEQGSIQDPNVRGLPAIANIETVDILSSRMKLWDQNMMYEMIRGLKEELPTSVEAYKQMQRFIEDMNVAAISSLMTGYSIGIPQMVDKNDVSDMLSSSVDEIRTMSLTNEQELELAEEITLAILQNININKLDSLRNTYTIVDAGEVVYGRLIDDPMDIFKEIPVDQPDGIYRLAVNMYTYEQERLLRKNGLPTPKVMVRVYVKDRSMRVLKSFGVSGRFFELPEGDSLLRSNNPKILAEYITRMREEFESVRELLEKDSSTPSTQTAPDELYMDEISENQDDSFVSRPTVKPAMSYQKAVENRPETPEESKEDIKQPEQLPTLNGVELESVTDAELSWISRMVQRDLVNHGVSMKDLNVLAEKIFGDKASFSAKLFKTMMREFLTPEQYATLVTKMSEPYDTSNNLNTADMVQQLIKYYCK